MPHQLAQKLHACTEPIPGGNHRVRDVIDICLLEALLREDALELVRAAAVETFRRRNTHAWPPEVKASPRARPTSTILVAQHPDAPPTVDEAVVYLRNLIDRTHTPASGR